MAKEASQCSGNSENVGASLCFDSLMQYQLHDDKQMVLAVERCNQRFECESDDQLFTEYVKNL